MPRLLIAGALSLGPSCATSLERSVRSDLATETSPVAQPSKDRADPRQAEPTGSLANYTALAMSDAPELRAAFERWQASVLQISRARRLPEPTISFSYFIRSVETRVGPQRAKLGLEQSFPWPSKLGAGAGAAASLARAKQLEFEAKALEIQARVTEAYWSLWLIRELRGIHREHLVIIRGLSETALGRLATGGATLADQQQIDLAAARLEDALLALDEREFAAAAELRAVTGLDPGTATPTTDAPPSLSLPDPGVDELRSMVHEHPDVEAIGEAARAADELARAARADRFPSFSLRAEWVVTDPASTPGVPGSGQDAVAVGAGLRVPLWQRNYGEAERAAASTARARLADRDAAVDRALARLELQLSLVRDSARRHTLYANTLLPQAEAAYDSVLGSYATGRGSVAQALLSQRDLLELRIELVRSLAQHATAWAHLEFTVGASVARGEVPVIDDPKLNPEPAPGPSGATTTDEDALDAPAN